MKKSGKMIKIYAPNAGTSHFRNNLRTSPQRSSNMVSHPVLEMKNIVISNHEKKKENL